MIRRLLVAAVSTVALAAPAFACDPVCEYRKVNCYEKVITYENRTEAYQKDFILYDECGRAYTVTRTCYRTIRVPVAHLVAITKWVKVCS